MRVITGKARGQKLKTLEGDHVRPTTDRVKEAIFSAIQFDVEGRRVLDAFAGSGQMGIEALSRGAKSAVFLDVSKQAIDIVKQNLTDCCLSDDAKVYLTDYAAYLAMTREMFDIAFLDPPYGENQLEKAILHVAKRMSDNGVIICEHATGYEPPLTAQAFRIDRQYKYGKISVTIYRRTEE